ncbi:unnamed protein product [Gadus morhua 'NCC']
MTENTERVKRRKRERLVVSTQMIKNEVEVLKPFKVQLFEHPRPLDEKVEFLLYTIQASRPIRWEEKSGAKLAASQEGGGAQMVPKKQSEAERTWEDEGGPGWHCAERIGPGGLSCWGSELQGVRAPEGVYVNLDIVFYPLMALDVCWKAHVGSRGKPDQPTPLMITFFVITNGESPSVWKVSISSNGGKISARKLLLTEPTNEITRARPPPPHPEPDLHLLSEVLQNS